MELSFLILPTCMYWEDSWHLNESAETVHGQTHNYLYHTHTLLLAAYLFSFPIKKSNFKFEFTQS